MSFHALPPGLSSKVFWPQQIAAGFCILSLLPLWFLALLLLLARCTPSSAVPAALNNTPLHCTNTLMQTCTKALTCTPTDVRAHIHERHKCTHENSQTKATLSHFGGMSEGFKKQGCVVIRNASAMESVGAGWVGGGPGKPPRQLVRQITPSCICLQ